MLAVLLSLSTPDKSGALQLPAEAVMLPPQRRDDGDDGGSDTQDLDYAAQPEQGQCCLYFHGGFLRLRLKGAVSGFYRVGYSQRAFLSAREIRPALAKCRAN